MKNRNSTPSKYMEEKLTDLKGKVESSLIIGHFN
jgi:hypothetical protein